MYLLKVRLRDQGDIQSQSKHETYLAQHTAFVQEKPFELAENKILNRHKSEMNGMNEIR